MGYSNHHLSVTQDGERGEDNKISKKRDGEGRGRGGGEGVKLKKGRGKRGTKMGERGERER